MKEHFYFCFHFILVSWEAIIKRNMIKRIIKLAYCFHRGWYCLKLRYCKFEKYLLCSFFFTWLKRKKSVWELKDCFIFSASGTACHRKTQHVETLDQSEKCNKRHNSERWKGPSSFCREMRHCCGMMSWIEIFTANLWKNSLQKWQLSFIIMILVIMVTRIV